MGIGADLVGDVERLLVTRTLGRRALFRMTGPESQCRRAEAELEAMYPGMRCLLLPSASAGLALLLEALALPAGSDVLVAPFGWLSNWSCLRRAGLEPRFLPLDGDLQLRAADVAERLGPETAAVVVTHLMGRGQQAVGEIARLCAERGIPLLEDVAQSLGVTVAGRRAGTFGAAAWCSLNHHKILSTGDGGFVLIRDAALFDRVAALHDQGCVLRDGKRVAAEGTVPGLSLRVGELPAALLRAQLARFHQVRARILARQRAVAGLCRERLGARVVEPAAGDLPFTVLVERPAGMRYPTLAASGWHVAANVPWLGAAAARAAAGDAAVRRTFDALAAISAVGSGFVDPYYSVALGLGIDEPLAALPRLAEELERTL